MPWNMTVVKDNYMTKCDNPDCRPGEEPREVEDTDIVIVNEKYKFCPNCKTLYDQVIDFVKDYDYYKNR